MPIESPEPRDAATEAKVKLDQACRLALDACRLLRRLPHDPYQPISRQALDVAVSTVVALRSLERLRIERWLAAEGKGRTYEQWLADSRDAANMPLEIAVPGEEAD